MLEAHELAKYVAHRNLVGPVSFQVPRGEIMAVMGPNGAGKSTLLKLLSGLMKASKGKVTWQGSNVKNEGRPAMGMLSHQTYLYSSLTGKENLYFYGSITGREITPAQIEDVLQKVGLEWDGDEEVGRYSRGMQQRLAMARLLLQDPEIILLDEPQTGLDQAGLKLLCEFIRQWKADGKAMVLVTHSCDDIFGLVDRLLILKKGHPAYLGECPNSPEEVLKLYQEALQGSEKSLCSDS